MNDGINNTVSLREHVEVLIGQLDRHIEEQKIMLKEQRDRDLVILDAKLETMNEFRSQIQTERGAYVTREALDLIVAKLIAELAPIRDKSVWFSGGLAAIVTVLLVGLAAVGLIAQLMLRG